MLIATVVSEHVTDAAPTSAGVRTAVSFEAFFMANERRLFRALFVVTADRHEAEDLTQLAFCRVWERWDRVAGLADPVGYLFRSAFNAHRSTMRRAVRAARRRLEHPAITPPPVPDEVVADRDAVVRILQELTPRQREALVLTELLDRSTVEAAETMHIRPSTVRALVSQARAALREVSPPGEETRR